MSSSSSSTNQLSLLENVALAAHYLDSNIYVRESLQELVDLRNVPLEMYVRLEVKKYVSKYNTYESRVILERINNLETAEKKRKNGTVERYGKRPISYVSPSSSTSSCRGEPVNKRVAIQSESSESSQSSRLKTAPQKFEAKRKAVTAQAPPSAPVAPIQRIQRPNCSITAIRRAENLEEKMRAYVSTSSSTSSCHGEPVNKKVAIQSESFESSRLKTVPKKFEAKRKAVTAQVPVSAPLAPIQRRQRPNCPTAVLRRAGNIEEKMRARREEKENLRKEGERRAAEVMADFKRCREQRIKEAQERKKNDCN